MRQQRTKRSTCGQIGQLTHPRTLDAVARGGASVDVTRRSRPTPGAACANGASTSRVERVSDLDDLRASAYPRRMSGIAVHRFAPRYGLMPRLTTLEAEETVVDGQRAYTVRRTGAAADGVMLSPEAIAIASYFDGTRDLRAVQRAIYEQHGQLLYIERIHELASALDRAGLLETTSDRAITERDAQRSEVLVRPATYAGSAYESDPTVLREQLDALFLHADGPGAAPAPVAGASPIAGLVAPHIDIPRGGPIYAHAYKALADRGPADVFVVFGTAHASPRELFTLTRRHYDTPFGTVTTDTAIVDALERVVGEALFRDERVHDEEHSIEFQAVYLKYLFGDRPFTLVPVLCSSLYGLTAEGKRPSDEPHVEKFLAALKAATDGRRVCYIASADLSHVGKLYGDIDPPSATALQTLQARDLKTLDTVRVGNANAFFDDVAPDGESRRICGLTPVYAMLRATGEQPARLLKYAQWFGEEEGSAVTYAAAVVDGA